MNTIVLMKRFLPLLMLTGLLFGQETFTHTVSGEPSSSFPGGYIGLGIQIGKTEEGLKFFDAQISTGVALIGYKYNLFELPAFCFLGCSYGKRFQGGKSQSYFDWQAVMLSFIQFGIGRGIISIDSHKSPRKKYWVGFPFIPLVYTRDNYSYEGKLYKQRGFMGTLPLPFFGFNFHP